MKYQKITAIKSLHQELLVPDGVIKLIKKEKLKLRGISSTYNRPNYKLLIDDGAINGSVD